MICYSKYTKEWKRRQAVLSVSFYFFFPFVQKKRKRRNFFFLSFAKIDSKNRCFWKGMKKIKGKISFNKKKCLEKTLKKPSIFFLYKRSFKFSRITTKNWNIFYFVCYCFYNSRSRRGEVMIIFKKLRQRTCFIFTFQETKKKF